MAMSNLSTMRLWQLISPSLPIGAFAYSQGLETAVEKNWVSNEAEAKTWITGLLQQSLSQLDAPIIVRLQQAWQENNAHALKYWNQYLLASRESSELVNEDQQMGLALKRLLKDMLADDNREPQYLSQIEEIESPTYASLYALAITVWKIPITVAIQGFLWSWSENQVAASIKLVPLGQTAGQRILSALIPIIEQGTQRAINISDDKIGALAPGFAIACAQHETQYSRLFRS